MMQQYQGLVIVSVSSMYVTTLHVGLVDNVPPWHLELSVSRILINYQITKLRVRRTEACAKSACNALLVVFLSAALALLSRSY